MLVLLTTLDVLLSRSRGQVGVQAEEKRRRALDDSPTGLPNRTGLHRHGALFLR